MRSEALRTLYENARGGELFVVGLGRTTVLWSNMFKGEGSYFLQALGGLVPFGFGLSLALPRRKIVVIDGDGSFFFNLGSLTTIGTYQPRNLAVVIMDNMMYESTGFHPTPSARKISPEAIAKACGIRESMTSEHVEDFNEKIRKSLTTDGPHFIDVRVESERVNLPVPTMDGRENKYRFVRHIEQIEGIKILRAPARLGQ